MTKSNTLKSKLLISLCSTDVFMLKKTTSFSVFWIISLFFFSQRYMYDQDLRTDISTPRTSRSENIRRTSKMDKNHKTSKNTNSQRDSLESERKSEHLPKLDLNCSGFSAFNCSPRVFLKETTVKI